MKPNARDRPWSNRGTALEPLVANDASPQTLGFERSMPSCVADRRDPGCVGGVIGPTFRIGDPDVQPVLHSRLWREAVVRRADAETAASHPNRTLSGSASNVMDGSGVSMLLDELREKAVSRSAGRTIGVRAPDPFRTLKPATSDVRSEGISRLGSGGHVVNRFSCSDDWFEISDGRRCCRGPSANASAMEGSRPAKGASVMGRRLLLCVRQTPATSARTYRSLS